MSAHALLRRLEAIWDCDWGIVQREIGDEFVDEVDVTLTRHFFAIVVVTFAAVKCLVGCVQIDGVVLAERVALWNRVDPNARFAVVPIATKSVELVFRLAAVRTKLALIQIAPTAGGEQVVDVDCRAAVTGQIEG
jgi:hypothetical protein